MAPMATIQAIQARVGSAVQKLIQADLQNPATTLTPEQIRANPYAHPRGQNGSVDANEAKTVSDPFARSVFEAAQGKAGEQVEEGGFVNGKADFHPAVIPAFEVSYGDLHGLQSDINAIVSRLQTDGAGAVTQAALDNLPQAVEAYFRGTYGDTRALPLAATQAQIAQVIREAATGVVEWK